MVQEALSNAAKHAQAAHVTVRSKPTSPAPGRDRRRRLGFDNGAGPGVPAAGPRRPGVDARTGGARERDLRGAVDAGTRDDDHRDAAGRRSRPPVASSASTKRPERSGVAGRPSRRAGPRGSPFSGGRGRSQDAFGSPSGPASPSGRWDSVGPVPDRSGRVGRSGRGRHGRLGVGLGLAPERRASRPDECPASSKAPGTTRRAAPASRPS